MSCPDPVELSRAIATGIDTALQRHLDTCSTCSDEIAAHIEIANAARQIPIVQPPHEYAQEIRGSLLATARMPTSMRTGRMLVVAGAVMLAAAAVVLAVSIQTLSRRNEPSRDAPYRGAVHAHGDARFFRIGSAPDEIVRLTDGAITVEVTPLGQGERFRVVTNDGEVEVRGTAFDVSASGDHLTSVRVLHGRVEVRLAHAQQVTLASGERWEAPTITAVLPLVEPTPEPSIVGPSIVDPSSTTTRPHPTATTTVTTTASPKHIAAIDKPATIPPIQSAPSTPAGPPPTAMKRPIELLFDEGWSALGRNDPKRAAEAFERAARSAPGDPLAEDALFWRATAIARTPSQSKAAIEALSSFITRYPGSNRGGEASAVLGWLLLDAGDLAGAEARFQVAARDPVEAVRVSANKGLTTVSQRRQ